MWLRTWLKLSTTKIYYNVSCVALVQVVYYDDASLLTINDFRPNENIYKPKQNNFYVTRLREQKATNGRLSHEWYDNQLLSASPEHFVLSTKTNAQFFADDNPKLLVEMFSNKNQQYERTMSLSLSLFFSRKRMASLFSHTFIGITEVLCKFGAQSCIYLLASSGPVMWKMQLG